ncbi:MAG: alanine--tRNA ligase-related protein, partial [Candidatus Nanohaloarchaea archaeon]|nr:alanine--tRNA ligase-related protein [Candidatus Nanohaloarchaea archaeon]
DSPTGRTFDLVSAWEEFSDFMEERGYEPIGRYPLAARWRDDTEVVRASIYDFQPYVVSGEVDPPANPLVVPQFSFRSNDIDNVGITGRHYTGFIMVGQHAFTSPEEYEQSRYFRDMLEWIVDGMGIPKEEVVLHEDSWGGGGNLGACMEFFVRGLELFNQVYMFYELDSSGKGYSELDTKVLDMGMGLERIVWMTHGSETSYEANMKQVVERLYERAGVEPDREIWEKFLPYSGHLNLDEVDDIDETWNFIADEIGVPVEDLKDEVLPAAHLYAIADHARTLLVALNDGLLPSNRGERHSLRIMARRCFQFIDEHGWDLDLEEVVEWHADEFGELYPELEENVGDVKEIIRHEEEKYREMKEEAERLMEDLEDVSEDDLVELYDSK